MEVSQPSLLALPPELRMRVYEYALACRGKNEDGIVELCSRNHNARHNGKFGITKHHSVLALLETCVQIYQEAASVFYYVNHLSLPFFRTYYCSQRLIDDWQYICTHIPERRLQAIEMLTLYIVDSTASSGRGGAVAAIQFANRLPKLRKLYLGLPKPRVPPWARERQDLTNVLKLGYQDIKPLLIQMGKTRLEDFRLVGGDEVLGRMEDDHHGLRKWESGFRSLVARGMSYRGKTMRPAGIAVSAVLPALRLGGEDVDDRAEADVALAWIEGEVRRFATS